MSTRSIVLLLYCAVAISWLLVSAKENENFILVAREIELKPSPMKINMDMKHCANLPPDWVNTISSTDTRGLCVRFWTGVNCTGEWREITPRSPSHNNLTIWDFNDKAVSLGPCRDSRDPEITGATPDEPFDITIYTEKNFQLPPPGHPGGGITLVVNGCTEVPDWYDFHFGSVNRSGHCLQLWRNSKCFVEKYSNLDKTVELRNDSPLHGDIRNGWGMGLVSFVSHCGYKCKEIRLPDINIIEVLPVKFSAEDSEILENNSTANDSGIIDSDNDIKSLPYCSDTGTAGWIWFFVGSIVTLCISLGILLAYKKLKSSECKENVPISYTRSESTLLG